MQKNIPTLHVLCELYTEKKKLSHVEWGRFYATVMENPLLCREILEAVYPDLYAIWFGDFFNLLLDHPKGIQMPLAWY